VRNTFIDQKIREIIEMAGSAGRVPMNLRVAWANLGLIIGDDRWSDETLLELNGLSRAFEAYIGKVELSKWGSGGPPPAQDLEALMTRIRALERLLPSQGPV
jgi:hypothetical protein